MNTTAAEKLETVSEEELLRRRMNRNGIITMVLLVVAFILGIIGMH